jgi:hypothetical protein
MSYRSDIKVHLKGFYLVISLFVIAVSIIAVYTTTAATEYSIKKDDIQVMSLTHLVREMDWLNDYEEQKIADKLLQAQIDTLGLSIQNNIKNTTYPSTVIQSLAKYKSYINILHADKTVAGSLSNLSSNVELERKKYESSLTSISEASKIIGVYELITILLIIGAGLGGISEIAKNKLIGYPAFAVGGVGLIILFLLVLIPSMIIGTHTLAH